MTSNLMSQSNHTVKKKSYIAWLWVPLYCGCWLLLNPWKDTLSEFVPQGSFRRYNIIAHKIGCWRKQRICCKYQGNELRTEDKKWRMILMKAKGASFTICDLKHQTERQVTQQCCKIQTTKLKKCHIIAIINIIEIIIYDII